MNDTQTDRLTVLVALQLALLAMLAWQGGARAAERPAHRPLGGPIDRDCGPTAIVATASALGVTVAKLQSALNVRSRLLRDTRTGCMRPEIRPVLSRPRPHDVRGVSRQESKRCPSKHYTPVSSPAYCEGGDRRSATPVRRTGDQPTNEGIMKTRLLVSLVSVAAFAAATSAFAEAPLSIDGKAPSYSMAGVSPSSTLTRDEVRRELEMAMREDHYPDVHAVAEADPDRIHSHALPSSKTRSDVRRELAEAEQSGEIARFRYFTEPGEVH